MTQSTIHKAQAVQAQAVQVQAQAVQAPATGGRKFNISKETLFEYKSVIALLVFVLVVSMISPNFFSTNNLLNILRQTSVNAIIAVGMTFVILTSGIDLAVGSILALTGALAATLIGLDFNLMMVVTITLAAGAGLGCLSGCDYCQR